MAQLEAWSSRKNGTSRHLLSNLTTCQQSKNNRRKYLPCLLLLLSLYLPFGDSFTTRPVHIKKHDFCATVARETAADNGVEETETTIAAAAPLATPADRFHTDMQRVLESRGNLYSTSSSSAASSPMERKERPQVLSSDVDGAERVATMLQHMVQIGVATEESYQIVLKAYRDRGRTRWKLQDSRIVCAADLVGGLLLQLSEQQETQTSTTDGSNNYNNISSKTCNLALEAYATCSTPRGGREYANQAQKLLDLMDASGIEVTATSVAHVVHAWTWQQENLKASNCAEMAQHNLDRITKLSPDHETLMQCYNWVLEARSKSVSEGSAQAASELLQQMNDLKQTRVGAAASSSIGSSSIGIGSLPNFQSHSNAILAWSKNQDPGSAEKAHILLNEALEIYKQGGFPEGSEPELIAFNGVIIAWARIGRPDKAEGVLWAMNEMKSQCQHLVPNVVTYNSVIHAHLRSRDKGKALQRIRKVVRYMEKNAEEQPAIKPDNFTYNTLMKAWIQSRRPDAPEQAEQILQQMHLLWEAGDRAMEPHNRHYNVVINSLAKSRQHFAARKAYALLQQMQGTEAAKPDIITYTSVIECFSKSSDPQAADVAIDLLQQASDLYKATGDPKLMPNLRTFTMVILALSKSPVPKNVHKARDLLIELVELYEETKEETLRPNEYPYNYVLNCAANCMGTTQEKISAFQIASRTYNDLRKSELVAPDSFTYAFWFKSCNNLLPEGELRTKCVTYAFDQCKIDGLVTAEVLQRLLAGTPSAVLYTLLNIPPATSPTVYRTMDVDELPPDWSRNAAKRR